MSLQQGPVKLKIEEKLVAELNLDHIEVLNESSNPNMLRFDKSDDVTPGTLKWCTHFNRLMRCYEVDRDCLSTLPLQDDANTLITEGEIKIVRSQAKLQNAIS